MEQSFKDKLKDFIFGLVVVILFLGVCFAFVSLLIGCSAYKEILDEEEPEPQVIEKEFIKEKIIYRNITVKEPCNITCPGYNYTGSTEREIELIRRIRFLEGQQDKFINHSDCFDELNKTKVRLEECEHELCYEWNSSWC